MDIAVLYPIAGLQAAYHFGVGKPYEGGLIPDWADYMVVGERLSLELRRDFTYLHPETLDARCRLVGDTLRLEHPEIFQDYRVLILPGSTAISAANLAKVKQFFDAGGKVIATTRLPDQSAEFGKAAEVQAILRHIFGAQAVAPAPAKPRYPQVVASSAWEGGGHDAALAFDGDPYTRWNARDGMRTNQWLEVNFGAPCTFSRVRIREVFDRAQAHRVEAWNGQEWRVCTTGAGIGPEKLHTFEPVTASRVRLVIVAVRSDTPSIAEFEVLDRNGVNQASLHAQAGRLTVNQNDRGGAAWFVETPRVPVLAGVLAEAIPSPDVGWSNVPLEKGGNLTCLHKEIAGRDFYFFANASDDRVSTPVRLRGRLRLERWDPHTGGITPQSADMERDHTRFLLELPAVKSVFLVGQKAG